MPNYYDSAYHSFIDVLDVSNTTITYNRSIEVDAGPTGIAISPDFTRVFTANEFSAARNISIIDPTREAQIATIDPGFEARHLGIIPIY
jgi:DNA-binding beta-propeller fold protein YncE